MSERVIEIVGPVGETAEPRIPLAPGVEGNFNGVMAHRPDLMAGFFDLYLTLWTGGVLDMRVKDLCRMAIARAVGCRICQNTRFTCALPYVDEADYLAIDDPAGNDAYSPGERAAIVFAGTMASGARFVTDDMVLELREHFGEPEIVELCVLVAMVGGFGSINVALNIGPDSPELQKFDPEAAARANAGPQGGEAS
jgi:alkylhydroperoxidase family enzyme